MPVTVVVTNSAGDTATAAVLVTVFGAPTAMITPPRIARPGDPITLALTASTPAGTGFTDYDVSYDNGGTWEYFNGVPPTTLTHTFGAEGTYTVLFDVYNDADGWVHSSAQVRVDVTPPAPVTNAQVSVISVGDTFLSLSWDNPADADYTGVMIRRQVGAIAPATANDGDLVVDLVDLVPYVVNPGLTPGTQYSYAVFAHDGSGNYATGVNMTGTTTGTAPHLVPPGPVTTLTATVVSDTSIKLDWVNPTDADFAGVTIRRAVGSIAPASASTGDPVTVPASATATSFTDTGLTAGTQYSYAVFSYDVATNHAAAVNITRTTTRSTTAVLLVDTTRVTVGGEFFCDLSTSYAATGATLTGTLDYGDGAPLETFSGDPAGWFAFQTYTAPGAKTMTWTVTDSTNKTVTKLITMNVFDPPTASIPATAQAQVGVPFTFPLTATTPSGTAFENWNLYGDWLAGDYGSAPPATLTHTFTEPGTYTFVFTAVNDAQGVATSSPMVVTVQ
jgi:plastocyanin